MAKVNRMLKQQLKMNNHRSRHIQKAKIESNLRSKIRIKFKIKKNKKLTSGTYQQFIEIETDDVMCSLDKL